MNKHIKNFIDGLVDTVTKKEYLFRKSHGLTFVFRRDYSIINDDMVSGEIKPVGIIYEENGEYYYAPLYDKDNIDEIIKEYIKTIQ